MRLSLRSARRLSLAALLFTLSPEVFAQTAGPATKPIEIPPAPTVNDPMLAPVPPAAKNIGSWEEALGYIRSRSTDLRIQYDEVLRAQAQHRSALGAALPQINATGNYTRNLLFETSQPTTVTIPNIGTFTNPGSRAPALVDVATGNVNLTLPIVAFRAWHLIGTTTEVERVAKLNVDDLKRNIALNVSNALVTVVTTERLAEINRIAFRSSLERLELAQRKRALGAANGLDVVRAQQDVEAARATLVTGDETLREARESLGLTLGLPTQVGVSPSMNMNGIEADTRRACSEGGSIEDRADLRAARGRVEIADRNIDDVKLQFLPTLNASTNVGVVSTPNFIPNPSWNIVALLTVPIWDGGIRYGSLRDTRAVYDENQASLEALRRNATVQVEQARRFVGVAEQSRKVAFDARQLAAELDRLTQAAYREGQGTSLELVTAAAALRQADVNLALQEFNLVKARILAVLSLANCPW